MDKQFILSEIQRTASNGVALGQKKFLTETGIKQHEWRGRYWARWGDAVKEAGLLQQEWSEAWEAPDAFEKLLQLARRLGRFPTRSEMEMECRSDVSFPSATSLRRFGSRIELKRKLSDFCLSNVAYADLIETVSSISIRDKGEINDESPEIDGSIVDGYVYLIEAQEAYKIGSSRAPYRRTAEIANQSAAGAKLIHLIATDDPEGIESYWHRRFTETRISGLHKQSGEWFKLSKEDIKAFKRRKTM